MKANRISRRSFIHKTAVTTGAVSIAQFGIAGDLSLSEPSENRSSHEVWIAGVSHLGLTARTPELMVQKFLEILKEAEKYKPDFICLPETFPFENIEVSLTFAEKVDISKNILEIFAEFSKQNNCYTICPVFTKSKEKIFNSAVVFDRTGKRIGQYDKIHEVVEWVAEGISCGPLFQPAIQTEFGPIGVQICYDINWDDGWKMLRDQGVKIIFWCSAFDGGNQVNMKALQNKCVVATSTHKNTSKICDMNGLTIGRTGLWDPNLYCAAVNLEKVFLPTYDYLEQTREIRNKYGRKVKVTIFYEEEWTIIECISPDIFIKDIICEFDLKSHPEGLREAEIIQNKSRL